ncbi:GHMP kinase [Thermaurantimonas aggregans]|uniref:GHMP kinase n=1 Tax=Thermaurantimonas aggregans TaxID=2173829 RepID=A0A401XNH8_9FLAO|nr:GHMP kinase [Thermaurantimonas aggregans]MCX8148436.1 GHMP kinase [Thermaurantimonas aggregans]GCD78571.1 GHMP kinase [Thermaurantimonas aggregans]
MIITKTPFRISFVGGGSDLRSFYSRRKGAVLSTTINKYMYISSHDFFEPDKIRTKYSVTETVSSVAELKHPILRTVLTELQISGGVEISSIADVPSGTGMGSSSSFTVGVLHNLMVRQQKIVTKEKLAAGACEVEIDILGEPIGKQDQYAAAYGGLNLIEFLPDESVRVSPLYLNPENKKTLEEHLVLFYIGSQRSASAILAEQNKNTTSQLDKFNALCQMADMAEELYYRLLEGDLETMGHLLHKNWQLKRQLAGGISNPTIDEIYETALKAGALGGKLLGAGGGGFMLFFISPNRKNYLIETLKQLRLFPFHFENEGSKLIYFGD